MATVLVVDDDATLRETVVITLGKVGHRVRSAGDASSALQLLREHAFDVVVSDIYMPGDDGLSLLRAISAKKNAPAVILMTGRGTIETTALARKFGAFDYLAKPFDLSELIERVRAAVSPSVHDQQQIDPAPPSRMVGSHPLMIEMYKALTRVAPLDVPVIIQGESGSGKELVARSIHDLSRRSDGPFVALNCGAIPDTLLENELFGSARGAYTDSRHDRRGAVLRADGGSLFLDEIGDVSPAFQVKLLRFLQEGVVTPLGSEKSVRVSVRVVTATHRNLRNLVSEGKFREDLYYRLAGYEIRVPPLRERLSDIPLLVEHFRHAIGREMGVESLAGPSQAVLDVLSAQPWRGNIRELEQVLRRTAIDSGALTDATVVTQSIHSVKPAGADEEEASPVQRRSDVLLPLEEAERRHIEAVLQATGGNQTQAAFILGIERKTLARKLRRFEIHPTQDDGIDTP